MVAVESSGNDKPVLELVHFGAPVIYSAEGRIVKPLDSAAAIKPTKNRRLGRLNGS